MAEVVIKTEPPLRDGEGDEMYWWNYPRELLRFNLRPESSTSASWINYITRMLLYIIILLIVFSSAGGEIAASAAIATLIFLSAIDILMHPPSDYQSCQVTMEDNRGMGRLVREGMSLQDAKKEKKKEGFEDYAEVDGGKTYPTSENPFMNISPAEIHDNPGRGEAAPITSKKIKQKLDDYFRVQWYSDPTDVFGKTQSQSRFITMPSTSIPNDRESLLQWQYGLPEGTCKSGNKKACLPGTDGSPVTWLNMD
jgi:hypothetical protein